MPIGHPILPTLAGDGIATRAEVPKTRARTRSDRCKPPIFAPHCAEYGICRCRNEKSRISNIDNAQPRW